MKKSTNMVMVGHLPSLTWHQLDMNSGRVDRDLLVTEVPVRTSFRKQPAGLSHRKLTWDEAAQWLSDSAPAQEPENVIAGKVPIYHPQSFGTGLGVEYDAFLAESGVGVDLLEVAEGAVIADPIAWKMTFHDGNRAAAAQIIHVGENASLTLVMDAKSEGAEDAGLAAVSTRVVMERGAQLTLVKSQTLGSGYLHFDDLGVTQAADSKLRLVVADLGAKDSYVGLQVEQMGYRASLEGAAAYMTLDGQYTDINYNVIQRGKKTGSLMTFDGVLNGKAKKSWKGTLDFRRGAKGAVGDEQENVLLLDPAVVNKTLPVILCEEEDMEGRHGATVGRLDEQMLFYLASRGIDAETAQRIMVRARLGAVIRQVPESRVRERLSKYVEEAFSDESLS